MGCDSMDLLKRWIANGYGMKIWPLMDIMYHKFYQFIHFNSILMDSLTFIASMSSQYPFFWECPGLPRCFTAGVLGGLQGPHMSQPSPGPEIWSEKLVVVSPQKIGQWKPKTENRRFSHSILKNRYTYWVSCQMMTPLLHQNQKSRKNS